VPAPLSPLLLVLAQAAPSPPAGVAPAPAPAATPAPVSAPAASAPAPTAAPTATPTAAPAAAPSAAPVAAPEPAPAATPAPAPAPYAAPVVAPVAAQTAKKEPREVGPFFMEEPPEETYHTGGPRRDDPPRFSLGKGKFCFVDDAKCNASLIATADVGVGVNILAGAGSAPDLPYAQYNFRGGLVLKPLTLTRDGGWHPWGLGFAAGWSRGTGSPIVALETQHTDSARFFVVNQLWLAQKRNAFHLDIDFGIVRSAIRGGDSKAVPAFGTHASLSANWGGWGGVFLAGDFLYQDTRIVLGFRGHGVAAGPAIGLILLGLLAGGAFQ
jgi:hypothetical protein